MKFNTAITILTYFILTVSCNQENKNSEKTETQPLSIEENIKTYVTKNADDPTSYQPLETIVFDTVMTGEEEMRNLEQMISSAEYSIESTEKQIEDHKLYFKKLQYQDPELREEIKTAKLNIEKYKTEIDSIKTAIKGKEKVLGYVYIHKYRIKNKFGALILKESFVKTDSNKTIFYFGDDF